MPPTGDPVRPRFHAAGMTEVPAGNRWLTPPEAERLQGFEYTKRREEARLGRWTAKHAIAGALGLPTDDDTLRGLVVRNAADGAPEVFLGDEPAGISISMTDRADWAVCTVVESSTAIGCDLEVVEPRSELFVRDWFTDAERRLVGDAGAEHDLLANLIWSAKESALKVLRTGLRRDTRSVEVTVPSPDIDGRDGWQPLTVTSIEGGRYPGWWRRFGDFVLTFAAAAEAAPPEPVREPSPLVGAVPTHSWMDAPGRDTPR